VIQRLELHRFKAFERFTLRLRGDAYLAGPNNAGKSTLTTALRISAQMVRIAMRRGPTETFEDGTEQVLGYSFSNAQVGLTDGNLRHEFRDLETRVVVGFPGGGSLRLSGPRMKLGSPSSIYSRGGLRSTTFAKRATFSPTLASFQYWPRLTPTKSSYAQVRPREP